MFTAEVRHRRRATSGSAAQTVKLDGLIARCCDARLRPGLDDHMNEPRTTGWRGPNVAGWIVIILCTWISYIGWTLWPVAGLVALCIPSVCQVAWERWKSP